MDTLEDDCSMLVGEINERMHNILNTDELYSRLKKNSSGKYGTLSQKAIRKCSLNRIVGYDVIHENKVNIYLEFVLSKADLSDKNMKNLIWWEMQDVEPEVGLVVNIKKTTVSICTSFTYSYDDVMEIYDEKFWEYDDE